MAGSNGQKLHRNLSPEAEIPYHSDLNRQIVWKAANNFPVMCWPDGAVFYEANSYLLHLFVTKRLALGDGGGSAGQCAFLLAELIRYLYKSGIRSVLEMRDSNFVMFLNGLKIIFAERKLRKRDERIRIIGSRCLDFINCVAVQNGLRDFVSPDGVIRGHKIKGRAKGRRSLKYRGVSWYHADYPMGIHPSSISKATNQDVQKLSVATSQLSVARKQRARILISVLNATGARVGEVVQLTVSAVLLASSSKEMIPLVSFITEKRGGHHVRQIPVHSAILQDWAHYIRTGRKDLMASFGVENDYLFVSLKAGLPLKAATLKCELSDIKLIAGIEYRLSAHSFRHKFVVSKLRDVIVEYRAEHKDPERSIISLTDVMKAKLREWLGHLSKDAIETYIHAALEDIDHVSRFIDVAAVHDAIRELRTRMTELRADFESGNIQPGAYTKEQQALIDKDLDLRKQLTGD